MKKVKTAQQLLVMEFMRSIEKRAGNIGDINVRKVMTIFL